MLLARRQFLRGLIVAPAIIKLAPLMRLSVLPREGVSMKMLTEYVISPDQMVTRLDVLYQYLDVRPEWAVVVEGV